MTPEQTQQFLEAMQRLLIASSEGVDIEGELIKLRDAEFQSGARLLWMSKESNGYVNFSHEEAMNLCGTSAKATLRYHLLRLRKAGVLRMYSTNGTVRAKFEGYSGAEMIVHTRTPSTKTLTVSTRTRTVSASDEKSTEKREQCSRDRAAGQLIRAAGSRDRAAGQHPSRDFADYPQSQPAMLVSQLDHTNIPERDANRLTATSTINPLEEAQSMSLMLDVGFWPNTAKSLAKTYPFDLIRRAVAHWYMNRRSVGGEFAEKPGIVVTWLNNPDDTSIPVLSRAFTETDLYRRHRTKSELVGDTEQERQRQAEEAAAQSQVAVVEDASEISDPIDPDPTADDEIASAWQAALARIQAEIVPSSFKAWFSVLVVAEVSDNVWTIAAPNQTVKAQVEQRFTPMLRRALGAVVGRSVRVVLTVKKS